MHKIKEYITRIEIGKQPKEYNREIYIAQFIKIQHIEKIIFQVKLLEYWESHY